MTTDLITLRTRALFVFLYTAPALLVLFLAYELAVNPNPERGLVLLLTVIVTALALPRAWARVLVAEDGLTLHMPLRRPRALFWRQIIGFETGGRLGNALVLRYHPLNSQGRPDPTTEQFLSLTPLERQDVLIERLEAATGLSLASR